MGLGKKALLAGVIAAMVSSTGCAFAVRPVVGAAAIYTNSQANEQVTDNPVGSKVGKACARSILGIVNTGDASVAAAAAEGNIKRIGVVDNEYRTILGIVSNYCVVVRGD